jgi:hypothetical protein
MENQENNQPKKVESLEDRDLLALGRARDNRRREWELRHEDDPDAPIAAKEVAYDRAIIAEIEKRGLATSE